MNLLTLVVIFFASCANDSQDIKDNNMVNSNLQYSTLPTRSGSRPETTLNIPHMQIGVELVRDVHEKMVRQVYSIPGIENQPSVVLTWQGLTLSEAMNIKMPLAIIGGREFGHIHDDGSLHIFLEPKRAKEAVESGWAIDHPFAAQNKSRWDGFVMLYTPQSFDELETTLQLIIDGFNYVTGEYFQSNE